MHRRALVPFVAAALVLSAPAQADTSFSDPAGDSGAAHDITVVAVANDATQVVVTFPVPNPWPNFRQAGDQAWLLLIDADRDPSTGDLGDDVQVQRDGALVHVWNKDLVGRRAVERDQRALRDQLEERGLACPAPSHTARRDDGIRLTGSSSPSSRETT